LIFQQDIAAVADAAVRKYHKETPAPDVTKEGITTAMKVSIKDSTEKSYKKLFKIVALANPALTSDFLAEVCRTHVMFFPIACKRQFLTFHLS